MGYADEGFDIPDGDDAARDMIACVRAVLWNDLDGLHAMLADADEAELRKLAEICASALALFLLANAQLDQANADPDAPERFDPPDDRTREAAIATLISAITQKPGTC